MRYLLSFISILVVIIVTSSIAALAQQEAGEEKRTDDKKSPFENRPILSLEFRGNTNFTSDRLRELMKYQKAGDAYSAEKLQIDLDLLRILVYADEGYWKTRFQNPEIEDTPDGIKIAIPVTEGKRYRIGEIKIENAKLISPDEVLQILQIKTGEIAKGYSGVQKGLERLKQYYAEYGYIQFNAEFIPDFLEGSVEMKEATVDITFDLEEDERYFTGKIEFTGNTKVSSDFLRSNLFLYEGAIYSRSSFDKSIVSLHSLGLFDDVKEEDCEVHVNETTHQVDLTIHLREKK